MRNRKPAIPVPWPASRADDIISTGVATKNSEHGTLIAMVDMIVANRMESSEDGSLINSSRAQPFEPQKLRQTTDSVITLGNRGGSFRKQIRKTTGYKALNCALAGRGHAGGLFETRGPDLPRPAAVEPSQGRSLMGLDHVRSEIEHTRVQGASSAAGVGAQATEMVRQG